jgi:glutamate decarboxylase
MRNKTVPNSQGPNRPLGIDQTHDQTLVADWEALQRIFLRPEDEGSRQVLLKYMEQILFGLHDFLKHHVGITEEISLKALADRFTDSCINPQPKAKLTDIIQDIIDKIAPHAVNVASPYFIGHMTSAIPFFMVHLQTIVTALNQNPVKLETSKIVSVYERQVLAKLHRLIFNRSEQFYGEFIQHPHCTLGGVVEDGTLANLTALWVARNRCLGPRLHFEGVEKRGLADAYRAWNVDRCVVLVSRLGHYSIRKAGGVLGIGNENVIALPVDGHNRIELDSLKTAISRYHCPGRKSKVVAVVGIAGTTETGTVDPLPEMGRLCAQHQIHFHVDAAWGGPTLLSQRYGHLLHGINQAESVTIDGHKQFYLPMSCGMVLFNDPRHMNSIAYHANYINRPGSVDLGIRSLVGSRAASALVLGHALDVMGADGYALLINHGIETAREFASEIKRRALFELVTAPQLNILTYRLRPPALQKRLASTDKHTRKETMRTLDDINIRLQRLQREAGNSFVSRTTLRLGEQGDAVVLRAVIMNPMTHMDILNAILDEQERIYHEKIKRPFPELS